MIDGTGAFDAHLFSIVYPDVLKLNHNNAKRIVEEISSERFRTSFVQAISFYRQKNSSDLVRTVQNMVSQYRAFPSILSWKKEDEIKGLYSMYLKQVNSLNLAQEVAKILRLSPTDTKEIMDIVK